MIAEKTNEVRYDMTRVTSSDRNNITVNLEELDIQWDSRNVYVTISGFRRVLVICCWGFAPTFSMRPLWGRMTME